MLLFLTGIIICLGGSFLTACSNMILKYYDNIQDAREAKGEDPLPGCNLYVVLRYLTLIGGAAGDLTSMMFLPFGVWAGVNVSNIVFYMLLAQCFLGDPLEWQEILILITITTSVAGTAVFGPQPEEKSITAIDDLVDVNVDQFLIFF